ncbi:MAG: multifunctional CCA tRNA nucleotidyl transferase/2'3'-cyclic phosphodiesterase/2'nucleotidase/phosphatase, partial [Gammaproteobacteria bacterium]|nr:multifunctional CCA tRNA nucleotidyl transferase/2'3'-cyclic phosphodiesterase/2'nucleotidase/phosphatase [Gammaproteobacteria bacterium]
ACEADHLGRTGYEDTPYPQAAFLREAHRASANIDIAALRESGLEGTALGSAIEKKRLEIIQALDRPKT